MEDLRILTNDFLLLSRRLMPPAAPPPPPAVDGRAWSVIEWAPPTVAATMASHAGSTLREMRGAGRRQDRW
jgi:hypothetical protein